MTAELDPLGDLLRAGRERHSAPGTSEAGLSSHPAFVGVVFGNPTVPSAAARFVSVHPVDVGGAEAEGGVGSLTPDNATTVLVYSLGPKAPAEGDHLICRRVAHRWVADRMGGAQNLKILNPGCPCTLIPASLRMTSLRPTCNDGMFQSCSIRWTSTPAEWAWLALGDHMFLSDETFTDNARGEDFRFLFSCEPGSFTLRRIYPNSNLGDPYLDFVCYRWPFTVAENTCDPFLLIVGSVFEGGDPDCVVTISE